MQYPWAVAGQDVVCIVERDAWMEFAAPVEPPPEFMHTYTITAVETVKCNLMCPGHVVLMLKGMADIYDVNAFQPVQKIGENEVTTSALERALELLND